MTNFYPDYFVTFMRFKESNESNQNLIIMNEFTLSILALISLAGLFLAWFFVRRARFKEKIILIEKGIDIKDLNISGDKKAQFSWLKIGIIIISISVGLLLGAFLMAIPFFDKMAAGNFPLLLIFLFAGIGMVLANFLDKPREQK